MRGFDVGCFCLLDGTVRQALRPSHQKRTFYSRHKHNRYLHYLMISAPDGMMMYAAGPMNGARQDNGPLHEHNFDQDKNGLLPTVMHCTREDMFVYVDLIFN